MKEQTQPFKFNFVSNGELNIDKISGYQSALSEIIAYIQNVTQFDPNKRFIDAVPLLNKIEATSAAISTTIKAQLKSYEADLMLQQKLS